MTAGPIKRVLVVSFSVVPSANRQGVELETVIKALAPRFGVDVLTIRTADMGYVERYKRTRMLRVPVGSGSRQEQVEAFRRAVRRQLEGAEYDLIHFRSAYGGLPVCQLKEYLDCKLVYEVALSSSTEAGRVEQPALGQLAADEQACIAHADLLIVRCQSAADALAANGATCPVAVVPPGVDIDTFDWEPSAPRPARRIVYTGTLGPRRGIRVLLEAFRELLNYSEANLILVGTVEEIFADYLTDALSRLRLTGHVHHMGPLDHEEIPRVLAMADLCVCPWSPGLEQPLYGYPQKLFEYMACRKPVVAADQPVLRELLGPRPPVRLVAPDDTQELASAMLQLLADEKLSTRLAQDGYNLVRSQFSASASRRALLTAYQKLYPAGTNLWGHEGVVERPVTGTYTSGSGNERFHDTMPFTNQAFSLSVTPTGGVRSTDSQRRGAEPWVMLTPDTSSEVAIPRTGEERTTDPEFVAAGELLGSALDAAERPPDTNPEGTAPPKSPEPGPGESLEP